MYKISGKLDSERLKMFLSHSQLDDVGVFHFPQNYIFTVYRERHRTTSRMKHLHHNRPTDDVVNCSIVKFIFGLVVEVFLAGADGLQQLQDVIGVQGAGLGGHTAGQVCKADVRHSLSIRHRGHFTR